MRARGSRASTVLASGTALVCLACGDGPSGRAGADDRPDPPAADGELVAVGGTEIFVRRMARGYELILYDQRLSGRSAGQVDSASVRVETFVDDIEALRLELGLGRVHLLAHSWGGLLALNYAVRYPDRLRSLVLVSPMPPSADLWQEEQRRVAERVSAADSASMAQARSSEAFARGEPDGIRAALTAAYRIQFHDRSLVDRLTLFVPEDYNDRSRQFGYMMPDLMDFDLTDRLGRIEAPTLILYGGDEPGASISGEILADSIARATLARVPEAGHFPFVERPEAFLSLVGDFLRDHPNDDP
jgi:proline iminopeptidase